MAMNRLGWEITESLNYSTRHSDFSRRSDYNAQKLHVPVAGHGPVRAG